MGKTPYNASAWVCVWQHKYVCGRLILGMTAKGTVKWEGHSWLRCNHNKKAKQNTASCLDASKKRKKKVMFASVTAARSSPAWGRIWQRGWCAHHHATCLLPCYFHYPVNCQHHPDNLLIPERGKNNMARQKKFLLQCVFKLYMHFTISLFLCVEYDWPWLKALQHKCIRQPIPPLFTFCAPSSTHPIPSSVYSWSGGFAGASPARPASQENLNGRKTAISPTLI